MESSLVKMGFPGKDLTAENGVDSNSSTEHVPVFCLWYFILVYHLEIFNLNFVRLFAAT
jgi:hypothetical protein